MLTEAQKQEQKLKIQQAMTKSKKKAETDDELSAAKAKIKELEEKNEQLEEDNEDLRAEQARKYDNQNGFEAEQATNAIINDDNSHMFAKRYEYKTSDGTPPLVFTVQMKAPTLSELGLVEQVFIDLTNGRGQDYDAQMTFLFRAIATFKVMGDKIHGGDVPEFLTDPKQIYRWDIVADVYSDFLDWQDTFQKTQRH